MNICGHIKIYFRIIKIKEDRIMKKIVVVGAGITGLYSSLKLMENLISITDNLSIIKYHELS